MVRRHIHYEAAFEDYVRSRGLPYIAVDETRRAIFSGSKVKSFDFLVYQSAAPHWLVDVKGRKFPYETGGRTRYWENWVTVDDLTDLHEWERVFGEEFQAVLMFAYWMTGPPRDWPFQRIHAFRSEHYAFLAVPLAEYKARCVRRSPKWATVTMPTRSFRELAVSF